MLIAKLLFLLLSAALRQVGSHGAKGCCGYRCRRTIYSARASVELLVCQLLGQILTSAADPEIEELAQVLVLASGSAAAIDHAAVVQRVQMGYDLPAGPNKKSSGRNAEMPPWVDHWSSEVAAARSFALEVLVLSPPVKKVDRVLAEATTAQTLELALALDLGCGSKMEGLVISVAPSRNMVDAVQIAASQFLWFPPSQSLQISPQRLHLAPSLLQQLLLQPAAHQHCKDVNHAAYRP